MRNQKIKDMAYYSFFIAIIAIMTFIPVLGYIPTFGTKITIIHIVVLIAAFTMGKKGGTVAGLAMGILCLIRAWTMPDSVFDYPFRNPIAAVLPRFIFGFVSGLVAEIITKKCDKNNVIKVGVIAVASVLLTAFHSIITVPLIYLCATWIPEEEIRKWLEANTLMIYFAAVFVGNSLLEMLFAGIAAAPIVAVLRPVYIKGRK